MYHVTTHGPGLGGSRTTASCQHQARRPDTLPLHHSSSVSNPQPSINQLNTIQPSPIDQSINRPTNQPPTHPPTHPPNQPTNQPTNTQPSKPSNESFNHLINQPINFLLSFSSPSLSLTLLSLLFSAQRSGVGNRVWSNPSQGKRGAECQKRCFLRVWTPLKPL